VYLDIRFARWLILTGAPSLSEERTVLRVSGREKVSIEPYVIIVDAYRVLRDHFPGHLVSDAMTNHVGRTMLTTSIDKFEAKLLEVHPDATIRFMEFSPRLLKLIGARLLFKTQRSLRH